MRTEVEIKKAILHIENFLEIADPVKDKTVVTGVSAQKKALEWVLTEGDYEYSYYCMDCHLPHAGLTCPKCGNKTLKTMNDKVLESAHASLENIDSWGKKP